ncbi:PA14 domain-containing protein [Pontibacter sp. E15-1]|uniref:PA14 domain-containing protein n=1 Tax=Pontibacter sp. E15-1 TaxID=2919918 RepID=UPI001F4F70F8|nr:PA14 domain-containing protein [Pontibacter sp. E15-1]MCJ8166737.1 PA14 domain-containing protein [Pontibacter sp. E15-1]
MNTSYPPLRKGASTILLAPALLVALFLCSFSNAFAQKYSGPLVITKGGTYSGNWESRDSEVAAVEIRTNETVIIENSNIRGAGPLIRSLGNYINLTVRHTSGYGITPTPYKSYKKTRRFLGIDVFKNVVVENCYMENTAGIYIGKSYEGNGSASETIKIRYNIAKNIDGRVYGGTSMAQFVQFNFKNSIRHAEIAWNQVTNEADKSQVEDNISMHNSRGTSDSPIRIHNNMIYGAFPIPSTASQYAGGGIIADGDGGINECPAYIDAYENHLVGLGNYSMGIAAGHDIRYHHNTAVNAATYENGNSFKMNTSGFWSKDYNRLGTTFSNTIDNNVIGVLAWGPHRSYRNDISVAENADFKNNTLLPNPISKNTEKDELKRWDKKLKQNGIELGPNGSGTSTPANQAPTVSLTMPKTFLQGLINLTAEAKDEDGSITKVEFYLGSTKLGEDTSAPYSFAWVNAIPGTHSISAIAYDNDGASTSSSSSSIQVDAETPKNTSEDDESNDTATGSGMITREYWDNIYGSSISAIPFSSTPTKTSELKSFEAPTNIGDNYGQRIRGYITAPVSGQYTFWIAGDDDAHLYLSTSEDPNSKRKIAHVNGWTTSRQWDKYSSQESEKVTLVAGKRYYIEALQKEQAGGDNLAVGWQLPNGSMERPVAGKRLSPIEEEDSNTTTPITSIELNGRIRHDIWLNVSGHSVSDVPVDKKPSKTTELSSFEAPSNVGDNYGQRISGYITAPTSGQYIFWVSGDNNAALWLSTSENPEKKVKLAHVTGWTNPREWDKYSSQKSHKVTLEAGKRYYIEALSKEEGGGDNLAVGWQLPNGDMERPIAGNRLSSGSENISAMKISNAEAATQEPFFSTATAYPNPFHEVVTVNFGSEETELAAVAIYGQDGRVLYEDSKPTLTDNKLELNLGGLNLRGGLYILKYTDSKGTSNTIKLIKQ